ncbi:MAG TPA: hypothetical protein PLR99_07855 [Polyangiaceae bacterium]|nr:hypothetical protein [Polyangiaceae bacterium]
MARLRPIRRTLLVLLSLVSAGVAAQAGCGSSEPDSQFDSGLRDTGGVPVLPPPGTFDPAGDSEPPTRDADPDALGRLVVSPASATVVVTFVDGVATLNAPVPFTASYSGQPVAATWLFDRGELGTVSSSGTFQANGRNVGEGTVTARFGAREGSAKVKVLVKASQNGAPSGVDAGGGSGGLGGVGGEPLGPPVSAAVLNKLKTESNAPASPAELGYLYPYDKTVWPRGLLAPLLMWQTTREAAAVYVKLSQGNYSFEGTYSYAGLPVGSAARKRVRLEDIPWKTATGGNQGDDLVVEVKIYSAAEDKVYGPIRETWRVASGVLKGIVYYNSYDSLLTGGGTAANGGVIAIKPRSPDPVLAIPGAAGKCHVCHTVSADGSTLWAQDGKLVYPGGPDDYRRGASYDLRSPSSYATRTVYDGSVTPALDRRFNWSAPYPDGSFALAGSRFAREAYLQSDAALFARAGGGVVASTGLTGVVASAVTPTFSPDGRKVAFNFWEGAGAGGVTAGAGRSLAIMDFSCGAAAGSTACAAGGPRAFAGLREIYRDPARYPSWPSFLPDGKAVVFNNQVLAGDCGPGTAGNRTLDRTSLNNCQISTWFGAKAELWAARDGATPNARRLDAANGVGFAPTSADHPNDSQLNYQPTVNPVPSGGYYWVVFTSRRLYGNLLTDKPWGASGDGGGPQKKLWVAAIDINAPAGNADPSHPAFYMPGQELSAGNTRGFWVVDPCKPNGTSCETGDECCNGFCRQAGDAGGLVCGDKPPGTTCVEEFEKCSVDADCCDPKQRCILGKCAQDSPVIR